MLPAWVVILTLLATGAGVALNPAPMYEAAPAPWEMGVLIPEGFNLYQLALCSGQSVTFPMAGEGILLTNGRSLDPRVGELLYNDNFSLLQVQAGLPGQTLLSFDIAAIDAEGILGPNQTLRIHLRVGLCSSPDEALDPAMEEYLNRSAAAAPALAGYLFPTLEENTYQLLACQGQRYSYQFTPSTQVRDSGVSDPGVADLVLYNPPGKLMIYATGTGMASLTFEADELDFPMNLEDWQTVTLLVSVIPCSAVVDDGDDGDLTAPDDYISLDDETEPAQTAGDGDDDEDIDGGDGDDGEVGDTGTGTPESDPTDSPEWVDGDNIDNSADITIGGGTVAIGQALNVDNPAIGGDDDEGLGTSSDDGTTFAAHVELNPGDTTNIFVGVSNEGQGDIAYTLRLKGASGVTVSASAGGGITDMVQTCAFCWKFVLPGGAGGAGTGITLTIAVADNASPGFINLGTVELKATNV